MNASSRFHRLHWLVLVAAVCAALWDGGSAASGDEPEDLAFFESRVRPVLVERCLACHGAQKQQGGLRFDSAEGLQKGGDAGPVIDRDDPARSRLIEVLSYTDDVKMPPSGKLPASELEALSQWIARGAPFPASAARLLFSPSSPEGVAALRQSHWSLQPLDEAEVPSASLQEWELTPIDRFISRRLVQRGLAPSRLADRPTLLRRATYDLWGLPADYEDIQAFVADTAPDAWQRAVERLLASPRYGERWGRHWLDVARYADTKGYVFTEERKYPFAYTYRDYVIRAFNSDLPYDRFLQEQIAADQLEPLQDRSSLAALGFLTLGRRFGNNQNDIIDDRIDVVTRGLMGLAVQCARCHDHKYDPIPTADYYSLYGVFASCIEPGDLPQIGDPVEGAAYREYLAELQQREQALEAFLAEKRVEVLNQLRSQTAEYLVATERKEGQALPAVIGQLLGTRDPRPELVTRWRNFIKATAAEHHPIFAPWHQLAALPQEGFADAAAQLLAVYKAAPSAGDRPINSLVRQMLAGLEPASMLDVAAGYGRLLAETHTQWMQSQIPPSAPPEGGANGNQPPFQPPRALPDPAAEELRQLLYAETGPLGVPQEELRRLFDRATRNKLSELRRAVEGWKANSVAAPPRAMVLNDAPQPVAARILIRGNPDRPGEEVPRRFLQALSPADSQFQHGSGRLELARAISSAENPLTARVLVNRVWMHHFGRGLVVTPGDFGMRGSPPTHPELLDHLASSFIHDGWSIKGLQRRILLSAVYQQASDDLPAAVAIDPENSLFWKMSRRRLEFEGLRDSLLAVADRLDNDAGGRPVDLFSRPFTSKRTVYGFIDRQDLPGTFRIFDFASPDVSTPQRPQTMVPQQALYGMNSPFVWELSLAAASRVAEQVAVRSPTLGPSERLADEIRETYRRILGRSPDESEAAIAARFVSGMFGAEPGQSAEARRGPLAQLSQALMLSNEFLFVD